MKYAALVLNCVAVLLLGWALYGVVQLAQVRTTAVRAPVLELAPLSSDLGTDQIRAAEAFDAMSRIQSQAFARASNPQTLIALPAPGRPIEGSVQMPERSMSLYLENLGAETQSVVIDGRLLRKGARLADGGRLVEVKPNVVFITERVGRQKLALPATDLRVGTLRWPDGSLASISTQEFRAGVRGTPPGPIKYVP